jgi:hypothetical protein
MGRNEICVRSGKGNKDRRVPLPQSLRQRLQAQRERALAVHAGDLADGHGRTVLPFALARKYPHADSEPGWQYLFPSARLSTDPPVAAWRAITSARKACSVPSAARACGQASTSR